MKCDECIFHQKDEDDCELGVKEREMCMRYDYLFFEEELFVEKEKEE